MEEIVLKFFLFSIQILSPLALFKNLLELTKSLKKNQKYII